MAGAGPGGWDAELLHHEIHGVLAQYRASLPDHRAACCWTASPWSMRR